MISRSMMKTDPASSLLRTVMAPPIRSTRFFVMAMPRPVPWILFVSADSSRENESKMVAR